MHVTWQLDRDACHIRERQLSRMTSAQSREEGVQSERGRVRSSFPPTDPVFDAISRHSRS
eukprot:6635795-Alexandrium_andersonii.AAC.1